MLADEISLAARGDGFCLDVTSLSAPDPLDRARRLVLCISSSLSLVWSISARWCLRSAVWIRSGDFGLRRLREYTLRCSLGPHSRWTRLATATKDPWAFNRLDNDSGLPRHCDGALSIIPLLLGLEEPTRPLFVQVWSYNIHRNDDFTQRLRRELCFTVTRYNTLPI